MLTYAYMKSPIGRLRISATENGLSGVHMENHAHQPAGPPEGTEVSGAGTPATISRAIDELHEYFAGIRTRFRVPLAPCGTVFQQRVWTLLQSIEPGTTVRAVVATGELIPLSSLVALADLPGRVVSVDVSSALPAAVDPWGTVVSVLWGCGRCGTRLQ